MSDKITKVEVVTPQVEEVSAEEKKISDAQKEQLFGNAAAHTQQPQTLGGPSKGAPPAQGPNLSKEMEEFVAAGGEVFEEQIPAPRNNGDVLVEPGKAEKKK